MSARLRRSFAQTAEFGSVSRQTHPTLVAAALFQSVLLMGLALTVNSTVPPFFVHALQVLVCVTVLVAAFVAYHALVRLPRDDAILSGPEPLAATGPETPPRRHPARKAAPPTWADDDAEHLVRLKARVSHDLRTPLNAVIGFSEMMQHEVLGPVGHERYREYATHIRKSAEYFRQATERTLAVTELLASPPNRRREAVDLAVVVEMSLARFRETCGAGHANWRVDIEPTRLVDVNHPALLEALQYLWDSADMLADDPAATLTVSSRQAGFGHIDICFTIDGCLPALLASDGELSPGAELNLLLTRLNVETAGGALSFEVRAPRSWTAVMRLPLATQAELELH